MIGRLFGFQLKRALRGSLLLALLFAALSVAAVWLFEERTVEVLSEARGQNAFLAAALGLGGSGTLVTHLASLLYGLVLPMVGALYAVRLPALLIPEKIETGEAAHLLMLPIRRRGLVWVQTLLLLCCLALPVVGALGVGWAAAAWMKPGALQPHGFLWLNLGLFLVMCLFGALGLMISCGAQERRQAAWAGTLLCLLFFIIGLLALAPGMPQWMQYLSFYWLYAPQTLAAGRIDPRLLALPLVSALFVLIGMRRFSSRDIE